MNEREEMKVTCIEPDQQALVTLANIEYRISAQVYFYGFFRNKFRFCSHYCLAC